MAKIFLIACSLLSVFVLRAQERPAPGPSDSLQAYVGKYIFPEGSAVIQIDISIDNGILYGDSERGKSEFRKTTTADVYDIIQFGAIATFKRNTDGKVNGIKVEVNQLIMEGTKTEPAEARYMVIQRNY